MNLPNKLTIIRIIMSFMIALIFTVPFHQIGTRFPEYALTINGATLYLGLDYIIGCILFVLASLTDFFDGYLARKNNQITDLGKMLDSIADKVLVNIVLIVLACNNVIPAAIPVIIITRDTIVDALKMDLASKGRVVAAIKSGKIKTFAMMTGLALKLLNNIPFEFYNIRVADFLIYFATIMSIVSMLEYIRMYLKAIKVAENK